MSPTVDPFTLEVIRHAFSAIAEEMSLVVMRSARSPLLREAGDAVIGPFRDMLKRDGWYLFLLFIMLYSLADRLASTMTNPFLWSLGFEKIEIANLVNCLVLDAVEGGASDIHVEPWERTLAVRLRISGVLTELVHLPLDYMEKISGRFKVMANLVSYQTDLPQS